MNNDVINKMLDDLLTHADTTAQYYPRIGSFSIIQVAYGKSSNLPPLGSFQARDYEHMFLCRLSDVGDEHRGSILVFEGREYSISDSDTQGNMIMLYGE